MTRDDDVHGGDALPELLWAVVRGMRRAFAAGLTPLGITPSQARAVRLLARHGPLRISQLSAELHVTPRSVTEVVDDLESKRLVTRASDPADRRAVRVELTERGVSIGEAIRSNRVAETERILDRLAPDERDQLAVILGKLRD